MADVMSEALGQQILAAVQGLGTRMDRLEARMDRLEERMDRQEGRMDRQEGRMDRQEKWMERLGSEFVRFRDDVREDLRQWRESLDARLVRVNTRVDVTAETVVLMASVVRGPKAFGDDLEGHLRELGSR